MGICFTKYCKSQLYDKLHKKILDKHLTTSSESLEYDEEEMNNDKLKSVKQKLLDNHYQSDLEKELG